MKVPPRRIFLPAGPFYKKIFTPCPFPRQPLRLAGAIYNPPGFLGKWARKRVRPRMRPAMTAALAIMLALAATMWPDFILP